MALNADDLTDDEPCRPLADPVSHDRGSLRDPLLLAAPKPERVLRALLVSRVASSASREGFPAGLDVLSGFESQTQK